MRRIPNTSGQVMLLTITIISASILGATTIGGILMLYQIRQANDILNSTKAIYAADAGIERGLYCANENTNQTNCSRYNEESSCPWSLSNNTCIIISPPLPYGETPPRIIRTIGESNRVQRAFQITITEAGGGE